MKLGFEILAWLVIGMLFVSCTLVSGSVLLECWHRLQHWRLERQRRRVFESLRARILRVGTIRQQGWNEQTGMPRWLIDGWDFECTPGIPFIYCDSRGVTRVCGYPPDELEEISARSSEWVELEEWEA